MAEIDPEDIKRVLQNPGFKALIERMKDSKTRKVMSESADDDARDRALTEFHALGRVMVELEKVANSK